MRFFRVFYKALDIFFIRGIMYLKRKNKKRRVVMKRILSATILLLLLASLCSCQLISDLVKNGEKEYKSLPCTKDDIDEFLSIADLKGEGLLEGYDLSEGNLYNVTPTEVKAETDYKIFKASDSCASFILVDGEIYPICKFFGGYGFVNAIPWDYDGNGVIDLLVASSSGSGIHCSEISLFNATTKESSVVYVSSPDERIDLIIRAESPAFSSKDPGSLPTYYNIYSVSIKATDANLAELSYLVTERIGRIELTDGEPVFMPTE